MNSKIGELSGDDVSDTPQEQSRNLTLFGEITDALAEGLLQRLLTAEPPITLWINSPGGEGPAGWALVDAIERLGDVSTVGTGMVGSMAVPVLMAGAKGKRFITPSSSLMMHAPMWSNAGSTAEIAARTVEVCRVQERLLDFMARVSGKPRKLFAALIRHEETWLTPKEAIKWGFADKILR